MRTRFSSARTTIAVISVVFVSAMCGVAQTPPAQPDFVIDLNRTYVYLVFDHMGEGPRFAEAEPQTRIWFRLVNNCRVPIRVRTFGPPKSDAEPARSFGLPKDDAELGVLLNVVKDEEMLEVTSYRAEITSEPEAPRPKKDFSKMPVGYTAELSSAATVAPGNSILFSIPTNFLGEYWHVEIPYDFVVPQGRCCRPENIGGEPRMVLSYSFWDLPKDARGKLKPKR